jgi:endonuclease/exonuclease/phosphatase family metal-dependent hydrolase
MPKLTITSWNVLADVYTSTERYPQAPPWVFDAKSRWARITEILKSTISDMICLQEVESGLVDMLRNDSHGWRVLWCPKREGRPDGCATLIRAPWQVDSEEQYVYNDGEPRSGHVAQLMVLSCGGNIIEVANTHLRWDSADKGTKHIGLLQAGLLVDRLDRDLGCSQIIAGDINDRSDGPVRQLLSSAGFEETQGPEPTACIDGQVASLDVICGRWVTGTTVPVAQKLTHSLPDASCPSDHLPVRVELHW